MYKTCPKCGHTRSENDAGPDTRCPACGLLFDKWLKQRFRDPRPAVRRSTPGDSPSSLRDVADALLEPPKDGRLEWTGRLVAWVLLLWLAAQMIFTGYEEVVRGEPPASYWFLHRIDLVFHEAGHVVFRLLGDFMAVLGGSLLQVLVPAVVTGAFLARDANNFGASVGLWWTGQSLSDVAIYIRDAGELRLPLLGGGTGADRPGFHDWQNILSRLGLLEYDGAIGGLADAAGVLLMLTALLWGALLLRRQHRALS